MAYNVLRINLHSFSADLFFCNSRSFSVDSKGLKEVVVIIWAERSEAFYQPLDDLQGKVAKQQ
jgi:hypothetical protein